MSDGCSSRNWECPFFQRDDRGSIKTGYTVGVMEKEKA